jgi:hypothetical protein
MQESLIETYNVNKIDTVHEAKKDGKDYIKIDHI